MLLIAGCDKPGDFCDVARPLYLNSVDTVIFLYENGEAEFADGVLAHDLYGEENCNWTPADTTPKTPPQ